MIKITEKNRTAARRFFVTRSASRLHYGFKALSLHELSCADEIRAPGEAASHGDAFGTSGATMAGTSKRSGMLGIRVPHEDRVKLIEAASRERRTLSNFMLVASIERAERILAEAADATRTKGKG